MLLAGCGETRKAWQFQGTAFDSGYHITLYADLSEAESRQLQVDIQGEVERLENDAHRLLEAWRLIEQAMLSADSTALWAPSEITRIQTGTLYGHGVDALAEWLEARGIDTYLIELGGDVRAGAAPAGRLWRLALEQPSDDGRSYSRIIELERLALATAGDFRDRPHANADTPPSWQVANRPGLVEVKVLHPQAMLAGVWANALLAMPPEEALELAHRRSIRAHFVVTGPQGYETIESAALASHLD